MYHVLLKYCRQLAGLTQAELSKKAGISESYYCKIERGKRQLSPALKQRLLNVFDEENVDVHRIAIIQTLIENRK